MQGKDIERTGGERKFAVSVCIKQRKNLSYLCIYVPYVNRLAERDSAVAIIEKFNGQTVAGSSAPLQVRFADSPAQKKLKNQTARKRILRPRDFQPMAGFPVRPMMPITPETMLGIAPAGYQDQQQQ